MSQTATRCDTYQSNLPKEILEITSGILDITPNSRHSKRLDHSVIKQFNKEELTCES